MKSLLIHRELKRIQHVGSNFKKQINLVAFRCDALQYCQRMSFFTLKLFGPVILMPCFGGALHFPSFELVHWSLLLTSFSKSIKQEKVFCLHCYFTHDVNVAGAWMALPGCLFAVAPSLNMDQGRDCWRLVG